MKLHVVISLESSYKCSSVVSMLLVYSSADKFCSCTMVTPDDWGLEDEPKEDVDESLDDENWDEAPDWEENDDHPKYRTSTKP